MIPFLKIVVDDVISTDVSYTHSIECVQHTLGPLVLGFLTRNVLELCLQLVEVKDALNERLRKIVSLVGPHSSHFIIEVIELSQCLEVYVCDGSVNVCVSHYDTAVVGDCIVMRHLGLVLFICKALG